MTKDDFITNCTVRLGTLPRPQVDIAVSLILELLTTTLIEERRIEIRGFGTFSVKMVKAKTVRNPKTGEVFQKHSTKKIHFKPGKGLRQQINGDNYVR